MITLLEMIQRSEHYLAERGVARPRRAAEEVIADALGLKRLDLYLQFEKPMTEEELPQVRQAVQRCAHHEPAAYIKGSVEFAGIRVEVNPSVFIPRQETEILVETIATQLNKLELNGKTLVDLCCGSGYIGIALKKRFPALEVILSDISEDALAVAEKNAHHNHVSVELMQGDLLAPLTGRKFDFLICNPPYVTEEEYHSLEPEVKRWEPRLALVAGKTGLEFYERLAIELKNFLKSDGLAWFEIGSTQGRAVQSLFEAAGWNCLYEKDWAGHDRYCLSKI